MKTIKSGLLLLSVVLFSNPVSHADVGSDDVLIAEVSRDIGGGTRAFHSGTAFTLAVLRPIDPFPILVPQLFEDFLWDVGDAGATLDLNSAADADFDHVTALLTNGINDQLLFGHEWPTGNGGGNGAFEATLFHSGVPGSPPDLTGYQITRVQLAINMIEIDSPGSNPNGDGLWTDLDANVTFRFFGVAVPEPATLLLGSVVVCGVMLARRGANASGRPMLRMEREPDSEGRAI